MNDDLLLEGIELLQEGKQQEAFDFFNEKAKNGVFDARYFRAVIDFTAIQKNFQQTKEDLIAVAESKSKFKLNAHYFLVGFLEMEEDFDNLIKYGEKFLKISKNVDSPLTKDLIPIYISLANAYHNYDNEDADLTALSYINTAIDINGEDPKIELFSLKNDILINLGRMDESLNVIENIQKYFGNVLDLYVEKFKRSSAICFSNGEDCKEELEKAKGYLDIATNFVDSKQDLLIHYINYYRLTKEYDKAIALIKEFRTKENYFESALNIERLLVCADRIDEIIPLFEDLHRALNTNNSKHALANKIFQYSTTSKQMEYALCLAKELYEDEPNDITLKCYVKCLCSLDKYEEAYNLIKDSGEDISEYLAYRQGCNAMELGKDYDEIESYFNKALKDGFITTLTYIDFVTSQVKNPKVFKKYLNDVINKYQSLIKPANYRAMAYRLLLGNCYIKQNVDIAKIYVDKAYNDAMCSCNSSLKGKYYELTNDHTKAFDYYLEGYNLFYKDEFSSCTCSHAYLAHAYIKGVGCEINLDKAKEIILDGFKARGQYVNDALVYLYTYFALNKHDGFSLDNALMYLNRRANFNRYDAFRILLRMQVKKALNMPYKNELPIIKHYLKFYYKRSLVKFIKDHLNDDVTYPDDYLF